MRKVTPINKNYQDTRNLLFFYSFQYYRKESNRRLRVAILRFAKKG